jgi:hypothetical protein
MFWLTTSGLIRAPFRNMLDDTSFRVGLLDSGPSHIKEAITLYSEGQSLLKLASHFGVATDTVALALRRAGVTLRPRRGWSR